LGGVTKGLKIDGRTLKKESQDVVDREVGSPMGKEHTKNRHGPWWGAGQNQ